jgi:hypothetical protein
MWLVGIVASIVHDSGWAGTQAFHRPRPPHMRALMTGMLPHHHCQTGGHRRAIANLPMG